MLAAPLSQECDLVTEMMANKVKLFCEDCGAMVDAEKRGSSLTALCRHRVKVRVIPFQHAKRGAELCLESARGHASAAECLSRGGHQRHAFFLVLTTYEEIAKCFRILYTALTNIVSRNPIVVEESLFREHPPKYGIAMSYLDFFIGIRNELAAAFKPKLANVDNADLQADRDQIRKQGFKIRNGCLYVDYENRWVELFEIPREKVERNLRMIKACLTSLDEGLHALEEQVH
jgi:AbiV family abortive infection protein